MAWWKKVFLVAYDAERALNISMHVGAALSEDDLQRLVATIHRGRDAVRGGRAPFFTTLVIADTENMPNAAQRKRIAEAAASVPRAYTATVTKSAVGRAVMTAIRWLSPPTEGSDSAVFATYAEARDWLVAKSGHPAAVIDAMVDGLRAQAR